MGVVSSHSVLFTPLAAEAECMSSMVSAAYQMQNVLFDPCYQLPQFCSWNQFTDVMAYLVLHYSSNSDETSVNFLSCSRCLFALSGFVRAWELWSHHGRDASKLRFMFNPKHETFLYEQLGTFQLADEPRRTFFTACHYGIGYVMAWGEENRRRKRGDGATAHEQLQRFDLRGIERRMAIGLHQLLSRTSEPCRYAAAWHFLLDCGHALYFTTHSDID